MGATSTETPTTAISRRLDRKPADTKNPDRGPLLVISGEPDTALAFVQRFV